MTFSQIAAQLIRDAEEDTNDSGDDDEEALQEGNSSTQSHRTRRTSALTTASIPRSEALLLRNIFHFPTTPASSTSALAAFWEQCQQCYDDEAQFLDARSNGEESPDSGSNDDTGIPALEDDL